MGGGGGGSLIFSYIRRLGSFLWVKHFKFQYFWGFYEKLIFFVGMKILWIFLGGSSQNWTIFKSHFYAFWGLFLSSRYRMEDIFWVC